MLSKTDPFLQEVSVEGGGVPLGVPGGTVGLGVGMVGVPGGTLGHACVQPAGWKFA